jgi:aminobenzoyl-glutamate utilization protein B
MLDRVINSAKAAAMGTETEVNYEIITGYFNKLPNKTLGQLMHSNLEIVGGISYTEKEHKFATTIMKTYNFKNLTPESALEIEPYKITEKGHGGSTDVGDISWIRPTTEMGAATWVPGTGAHSWQAVAAGGTSIGEKGMMVAIKTLTLTAIDLFKNPDIIEKADKELVKRRGTNFVYKALLGDRNPPLDYRLNKK